MVAKMCMDFVYYLEFAMKGIVLMSQSMLLAFCQFLSEIENLLMSAFAFCYEFLSTYSFKVL